MTSDKLQMLQQAEMLHAHLRPSKSDIPEVLNSSVGHERRLEIPSREISMARRRRLSTEENQELDWQVHWWVKLSFDKNDMSDILLRSAATGQRSSRNAPIRGITRRPSCRTPF